MQAPLAGGPRRPALAAAVCEAGGLGFLAAGYKTADAVRADLADAARAHRAPVRRSTSSRRRRARRADDAAVRRALRGEAVRTSVELGEPRHDDDGWEEKLDVAEAERVPVVSFTFGCPAPRRLRRACTRRAPRRG